ncbi:hypothetical protein fugu_000658 [Takifugu bimaculatus]|uniref:FAM124 domain-containing protein n=1 Tax=Takifugu bimaculatus TaxID=433685 RepID=A0A4Z2CHA7_9TELE|nr:hypothetical protein fugu_000658 [Takifugu bimaculatus]
MSALTQERRPQGLITAPCPQRAVIYRWASSRIPSSSASTSSPTPAKARSCSAPPTSILACVHPELQLFRISERALLSQRPRAGQHRNGDLGPARQPALAVILFLQEACGGEEEVLMLHRTLQRPPWRYHHTEQVSNGRRMLPLTPCSQDFFTLSPGTPLWAVRQVHYGKEIVRFTVYCQHENYGDMVRLYKLLLQRRVAQKKEDFCFFVVYSNPDMEIQLSFKRLPRGQKPVVLESAVMEVRVRDVGALVPLLPHPCGPISEVRWQTEDYDGNKVLLQVQAPRFKRHKDPPRTPSAIAGPSSAPPTIARNATSHRNRRHHLHQNPRSARTSVCEDAEEGERWAEPRRTQGRSHRSGSMFSPTQPGLGQLPFHLLLAWTHLQPPSQEPPPPTEQLSRSSISAQRGCVGSGRRRPTWTRETE